MAFIFLSLAESLAETSLQAAGSLHLSYLVYRQATEEGLSLQEVAEVPLSGANIR